MLSDTTMYLFNKKCVLTSEEIPIVVSVTFYPFSRIWVSLLLAAKDAAATVTQPVSDIVLDPEVEHPD